ncbi:MAG: hypothetical protein ACLR78_05640 [Roseburia sp.]
MCPTRTAGSRRKRNLYCGIGPVDNFDRNYQMIDPCGWTGQMGFGEPEA